MIAPEVLVGWGATAAALVGHIFVANYRINQSAGEIEKIWTWKNAHEKDVADKRLDIQKAFGNLEGKIIVLDGNYTAIKNTLDELKAKLDKIDIKIDHYRDTKEF